MQTELQNTMSENDAQILKASKSLLGEYSEQFSEIALRQDMNRSDVIGFAICKEAFRRAEDAVYHALICASIYGEQTTLKDR